MKYLLSLVIITLGFCQTANADVWKWIDINGKMHFVDTMTPIYTWVGDLGKINYSDTPDHEDAVSVVLVWVSKGNLEKIGEKTAEDESDGYAHAGETAEERDERENAAAYYCKRATEIYDSYVNAPRLFSTNADGEREYLSDKEAAATIADTKAKKDEFCR
jgi:hypothetical protein